ncbi:MAG: type VII toxin-antitoxin system HepT family RNase toxin [Vulcanisaeta sp.]|uniref:type VII toxin-antitoxin system HepT family RNase toxin n=1 Tax=Vulcanisaeta sp. TaxID=2020871 RepID=UPI003D0CB44B
MAIISRLLRIVEEREALLNRYSPDELSDIKAYYSAVYLLQTQAQALIDLAQRVATLMGMEVSGYVDAGEKLSILGVISPEDLRLFKSVVTFRNIVVHQYAIVDLEIIRRIITNKEYRRVTELARKIAGRVNDP